MDEKGMLAKWAGTMAEARIDGTEAGLAEKQKGMAAAASGHGSLLEAAKAVARKLAANGPVTIDDVVSEMRRVGYRESDIRAGDKVAKNWKGSVFAGSEWVCVGQIVSREKSAHGRPVRQWATRGWLRVHPMNGLDNDASAFRLWRMFQEAAHHYPEGCEIVLLLGRERLDASFLGALHPHPRYNSDGTVGCPGVSTMFGCRVYPVHGVGALFMPRSAMGQSFCDAQVLDQKCR